MEKDYSLKIKKLNALAELLKRTFVIAGALSFAIIPLGGIVAGIVAGLTGYEGIKRLVIPTFLFCVAITTLFGDLVCAIYIWVEVLEHISGEMKLRYCISGVIGYGIGLSIFLGVGFSAIKWGIKYLVDPAIVNRFT